MFASVGKTKKKKEKHQVQTTFNISVISFFLFFQSLCLIAIKMETGEIQSIGGLGLDCGYYYIATNFRFSTAI